MVRDSENRGTRRSSRVSLKRGFWFNLCRSFGLVMGVKDELGESIREREKKDQLRKHRHIVFGRTVHVEHDDNYEFPNYQKTLEQVAFLDQALKDDKFIFSDMTDQERSLLIQAMQPETCPADTIIIQQGDVGDFFYVLQEGTVTFIDDKRQKEVGSCSNGGSFGELALLYDAPRAATCKAATDCSLWKVDQTTFRHLLARLAHNQESGRIELLNKVPLFAELDKGDIIKISRALVTLNFEANQQIVRKGEVGEVFYILQAGQVKVHDIGSGDSTFVDQVLSKGDWFGERALMTGEPRAANVTAITPVTAFAMDRKTFESSIGKLEGLVDKEAKKRILKSLPLFANAHLMPNEYNKLSELITEQTFDRGHYLEQKGKPCKHDFYMIREGQVTVREAQGQVWGGTGKRHVLRAGDYFGERSLCRESWAAGTDDAMCDEKTTCWVLSQKDIESVIGDIHRLDESKPQISKQESTTLVDSDDIEKHRILGLGAFGKVWLASSRKDNKSYALKALDKRKLIKSRQVKGVIREKEVMGSIHHPFILGLVGSFQDTDNLYLLVDLVQGGELFSLIYTNTQDSLSNEQARFYAACVSEGLGHMHQRQIAYRDLKPENILIGKDGYCVIVDMGFAKVVAEKTFTMCGTPEYLAPEVIMSKGHDKAVDWWSFGVLVYEMLIGSTPFFHEGADNVSLFKRIVKVKYSFPAVIDPDAKDLIEKLLVSRQSARLGNLSREYLDVQGHPWFELYDFREQLVPKKIRAPWTPRIWNRLDSSYFDDYTSEEADPWYPDPLTDEEQALFEAF